MLEQIRAAWGFAPDFVAASVRGVTPDAVRRLSPATKALCFDIDGTITDYHAPTIDPADADHLRSFRDAGFATYVISNCYGERAEHVHRLFAPLVTAVFTPGDCVEAGRPGDTARRHAKPAPDMVLAAASGRGGSAERLRGDEVLVVGDQLLKDVAAARAAAAAAGRARRRGRGGPRAAGARAGGQRPPRRPGAAAPGRGGPAAAPRAARAVGGLAGGAGPGRLVIGWGIMRMAELLDAILS